MKVVLPRMNEIDLDNLPNNITERVQKAFREFTEGTNPEFMFHDQLYYIDLCIKRLHKADVDKDVDDMISDWIKFELHESDVLPENDDVLGYSALLQAYKLGVEKQTMYSYDYGSHKDDRDKCMKLLITIIKAVLSVNNQKGK